METFEDVGDEFGAVRSRHRVDNKGRLVSGFVALVIGVVATPLGVFLWNNVDPESGVGPNRLVGAVLAIGLAGLVIAVLKLAKAWRGGSDECFEIREDGIVYITARQVRGWSWDGVTAVTLAARARETSLSRALGTGYRCVITFEDGARVKVDGMAENPHAVLTALRQHRPDLPITDGMNGLRRLGTWWLAFAAVFLGAGIWMVATITGSNSVQDVTDANGNVTETEISTVSDSGYVLLAIGLVVCLIGLITSLVVYFSYLTAKPHAR